MVVLLALVLLLAMVLIPASALAAVWLLQRQAAGERDAQRSTLEMQARAFENALRVVVENTTGVTNANASASATIAGAISAAVTPRPVESVQSGPLFDGGGAGPWWTDGGGLMTGPADPLDRYEPAPQPDHRVGSMPADFDPLQALRDGGGWGSVLGSEALTGVLGGLAPPELGAELNGD